MSADGRCEMPAGFGDVRVAVRNRDVEKIAQEIFHTLQFCGSIPVPPPPGFSDPKTLERWRKGVPMPDVLAPELVNWLESNSRRSAAIGENTRRLRSTTWAQVKLRQVGDYWEHFAAFHKREWGIVRVCIDDVEREAQVLECARRGRWM
jgi:hypothetical protein